ncbi:MAG: VapE domain-containing protein [Planctomycetota bacterium]
MSDEIPNPNHVEAIAFLRALRASGWWTLCAIEVDGNGVVVETFEAGDERGVREFIARRSDRANLYYAVNPTREPMNTKPRARDVAAMEYLHVDVDPRAGEDLDEERTRILRTLRSFDPAPTVIVDSGNGYQALWCLDESVPVGDPEDAKLWNLALERKLGADSCHNVDRLLRLPGTINRPDAKKRERGRVPRLASVVDSIDARYSIDSFEKAEPPRERVEVPRGVAIDPSRVKRLDDLGQLPAKLSAKARATIETGRSPSVNATRSEPLMFACCEMVRAGVDDDVIYSVITDPRFTISSSVLDKGHAAHRYAVRQIQRARDSEDAFQETDKGSVIPNQTNIRRALAKLGVVVEHDEFADVAHVRGLEGFGPRLDDKAMTRLRLLLDQRFAFLPSKDLFYDVVADVSIENGRHPVREYLDALTWDGEPRLSTWLSTYLGAPDSDYTRAVGRLVLVAAVRRVRRPGAKFDEMLVLEGRQGGGKSTALATLAVRDDWFVDDIPLNADTKRQMEVLAGRWIVEAGELKGMRKGDVEALKSFLSRTHDRARLAYGRATTELPRQCVIIGTTNAEQYLRDPTGNRRFWPVATSEIEVTALRRDRDQLWAEASIAEAAGESIRLDPSLYEVAAAEAESRERPNAYVEPLSEALADIEGKIASEDLWRLLGLVDAGRRTQQNNDDFGDAMRRIGWEKTRRRFDGRLRIAWVRGDGPELHLRRRGDEYEVVDASLADEPVDAEGVF